MKSPDDDDRSRRSPLAERIGPVYATSDLAHWLADPEPGHDERTINHLAENRELVAFRTNDNQWAFPEWGFTRSPGQLAARPEVIALWQQLPHTGFLTDADLAAWMNTRFETLAGTPIDRVHTHGIDDEELHRMVSHLRRRVGR